MILAVYQLQLYVTLKIFTELKIFRGGQGPPLSALMCSFFSHRPGATTFSPVVRLCSRPGPTLAPVVCCALFFFKQARGHVFQPCYGHVQEQTRSGPCGMFRLQTVALKNVLASCVVLV